MWENCQRQPHSLLPPFVVMDVIYGIIKTNMYAYPCAHDFEYLENRSLFYIYAISVANYTSNLHHNWVVSSTNLYDHLNNISKQSLSPNNINTIFIPKYQSIRRGRSKAKMPATLTITKSRVQYHSLNATENEIINYFNGNHQFGMDFQTRIKPGEQ